MRSRRKIAAKLSALLLTFAIMHVYVLATPAAPNASSSSEKVSSSELKAPVFGRLSSFGAGKVVVNGNEVLSGTTILSGAQIQTPATTGATITLASVGRLDIAPRTNLTLTFDRSSIIVNVISGDALLTGNEGVRGILTGPDGKTKNASGQSAYSIGTAMYQDDPNKDPDKDNNRCRIAGMPCALFWVMVGGGTAVAIGFAATRGNNPSGTGPQ